MCYSTSRKVKADSIKNCAAPTPEGAAPRPAEGQKALRPDQLSEKALLLIDSMHEDARARYAMDDDSSSHRPAFCCCEFVDRHGASTHLADMSAFDDAAAALWRPCAPGGPPLAHQLRALALDCDDRIRFPMWGGSLYLGLFGALPILLLPLGFTMALESATRTLALIGSVPFALAVLHSRRERDHAEAQHCEALASEAEAIASEASVSSPSASFLRSYHTFFTSWTLCTLVYTHAAFTLLVGAHIWFGWWLLVTAATVAAAASAHAARATPPAMDATDEEAVEAAEAAEAAEAEAREDAPLKNKNCHGAPPQKNWKSLHLDASIAAHNTQVPPPPPPLPPPRMCRTVPFWNSDFVSRVNASFDLFFVFCLGPP